MIYTKIIKPTNIWNTVNAINCWFFVLVHNYGNCNPKWNNFGRDSKMLGKSPIWEYLLFAILINYDNL